jgi:hypothetical protein
MFDLSLNAHYHRAGFILSSFFFFYGCHGYLHDSPGVTAITVTSGRQGVAEVGLTTGETTDHTGFQAWQASHAKTNKPVFIQITPCILHVVGI